MVFLDLFSFYLSQYNFYISISLEQSVGMTEYLGKEKDLR